MPGNKLSDLLKPNKNEELGEILERAGAIGALTQALSGALPDDLSGSLVAASVKPPDLLVVVARSPAFAARLRFEETCLLRAAREAGETVKALKVRVSHPA
ncbi:MAG: DciA family protein [Pseudomonadota bacterium]